MRTRLTAALLGIVGVSATLVVARLARRSRPSRAVSVVPRHDAAALPRIGPGAAATGASVRRAGARMSTERHVREPHPTGVFAAIGRFDYRFRRVIPVVGLGVLIGVNVWATAAGGSLIQGGWVIAGSQEQQAAALLADRFGQQATTMLVLFRDPAGNAASATFQSEVKASLAQVAADRSVARVVTYADARSPQLLSRDGRQTMAVVTLDKQVEAAVEDSARLAAEVKRPPGVEVTVTGVPQVYHEFNQKIEHDLVQAELISLPIALVILLAVFGTLVGASLPLLVAAFSMGTAFAVIRLLAGITDMSVFVNNLASMIGLALAIDYSLFLVSRFREELRHHRVEIALERSMGSVGKAVAVSGIAVAIGLSSLTVFEADALRSMGIAGIVTVVSTLLFGLTVLPSLLAMLGTRVNRLRIPLPGPMRLIESDPDGADRRQAHGVWAWIAAKVMRRPLLVARRILLLLLAAGSPFLSLQLSTGQNLSDLPPTPARIGFDRIVSDFPGGESDPVSVAVTWPGQDLSGSLPPARQDALAGYVAELKRIPGVTDVQSALLAPPGISSQYAQLLATPAAQRPAQARAPLASYLHDWLAGDTTKLTVFSRLLPDSDAGRAMVADIRSVAPPAGAQVLTGGLPSRSADFMASFRSSVPVAVLIVVLATAGVLLLTFGSVVLPVKAVLMSLISISASFGALVFIFQQGHFSGALGFEPSGAIAAWLPVIMFAILFGLSMDYEVLLLSRIRERYLATADNTRAVAEGIGITGGIITGAALIMVAVFGAFGLSSITFIKALGFTMALAVLIDATFVRGLLVPAFMRVMGRVNWWAPSWIQRAISRVGLYEGPAGVAAPVGGAGPAHEAGGPVTS